MDPWERLRAGGSAVLNDLPLGATTRRSDEYHLEAAMEWLRASQDATGSGGAAATYNLVLGWEDAYPETTGYIVPTMYDYAGATGETEFADRAARMAEWLLSIQHPDGHFPAGTGVSGEPSVFNTGQIVFGLARAHRETGRRPYEQAVRAACDWLVDQQSAAGYWAEHDYRGEAHAYSTRVAWALLEGADVVPERTGRYRAAARSNLRWAVDLQRPNGWFERAGFSPGVTPYLHTIAYTVRGLLEGGVHLEDAAFVDAATETADVLLAKQRQDGVLKGAYDASWAPAWYYCLPGNAQMALVWRRLYDRTGERRYREAAGRTIEFLERRQIPGGPSPVRGGVPGSFPIFGPYMSLRLPNWGAKFFGDLLLHAADEPRPEAVADPLTQ